MDPGYVFACGIVWRYTADPEAGWELIRALRDHDRDVQELAAMMLTNGAQDASSLLNAAVASGAVSANDIAEVFESMARKPDTKHRMQDSNYGPS
jgi:hypothetical protein